MLTVVFDAGPLITACKFESQAWMLPDLVLELAERGSLTTEVAEAILKVIRPRYRVGVIEHSLVQLQEVKRDVKSRSTG